MREQLLGYLLEALDADERSQLEDRLRSDLSLQRDLELLAESLEPLQGDTQSFDPPPSLATRTCAFVARKGVQPTVALTGAGKARRSNWSLADFMVAAGIVLAATTLLFPALQHSRDNARVAGCQNNLRQVGTALTQFSNAHGGYFPSIPASGNLSAAGLYAVQLAENELLPDARILLCPSSPLARQCGAGEEFRVPTREELSSACNADRICMAKRMGGSFGYNLGFVQDGVYRTVKYQGRPRYALMADAPSLDLEGRRSANHGGRGHNVLYEDGHVEYETVCLLEDTQDHVYLNDDGQMAAGIHSDDAAIGLSHASPLPRLIATGAH